MKIIRIALACLAVGQVRADTHWSATCSRADVQAAIDLAVNGDSVRITNGSATWTTSVDCNGKNIDVGGGGVGVTIITCDVTGESLFYLASTATTFASLHDVEFRPISFPESQGTVYCAGLNEVNFRIHHCKFLGTVNNNGYRYIFIADTYGLIDNCVFVNHGQNSQGISPDTGGTLSITNWNYPQPYGTTNCLVVEDCGFGYDYAADSSIDMYPGTKVAFRYNCVTNTNAGSHGEDSSSRSPRLWEFYMNKFYGSVWTGSAIKFRGGTGVCWSNSTAVGSSYGGILELALYRANPDYGGDPGRSTDGNYYLSYPGQGFPIGYPLRGQHGFGSFPNTPGNDPTCASGCTTNEYQQREPVYQWGNNEKGDTSPTTYLTDWNGSAYIADYLKVNREFYDNTQKPNYTPLAYPHPMRGEGSNPDTNPPVISDIASNAASSTCVITWTTDEASSSGIAWGPTSSYGSTATNASMQSSHSLTAINLSASTLYHFKVWSMDASGNGTNSADFTFTTIAGISTYFCSLTGNDGNHGTIGAPWRDPQYAVDRMKTNLGSTLYFRGGAYDISADNPDMVNFNRAASGYTKIMGYPGETTMFYGSGSGSIGIVACSNMWFSDIILSNLQNGVVVMESCSNIVCSNLLVRYMDAEAIHFKEESVDCLIVDSEIVVTGLAGFNGEGVYVGTAASSGEDHTHNIVIRSNYIHNTYSEGVELKEGTYSCIVEYNRIGTNNTQSATKARSIEVDNLSNLAFNPAHIVRNNIVFYPGAGNGGILAGTGCSVYNNVVYGIASGEYGILTGTADTGYKRHIYHNTIVTPTASAVLIEGSVTAYVTNNIGPSATANTVSSNAFFVYTNTHNYALTNTAWAINRGADIRVLVPTDILGVARDATPDLGAYEGAGISAPRHLRVISGLRTGTIRGK